MKTSPRTILICGLAIGLLFDLLFYGKSPGISLPVFSIALIAGGIIMGRKRIATGPTVLVLIALFFSIMVAVRANGWLQFIDTLLVIYLLLLAIRLHTSGNNALSDFRPFLYVQRLWLAPLKFLHEGIQQFRALRRIESGPATAGWRPVIRGIVISIPLLLLFGLLLSAADPLFKRSFTWLVDVNLNVELPFRIGLIVLIGLMAAGVFSLISRHHKTIDVSAGRPIRKLLAATESIIILGSVSALFFVFLIVQASYLFGGDGRVLGSDLTYADYARKGFFELIVVASLSMLLLLAVKALSSGSKVLKYLSLVVVLEVLIIMISAHSRLSLYEVTYGFTLLRLFSHGLILWLAAVLVLFAIYLQRGWAVRRLAYNVFISVIAFAAVANVVNPDALVARWNLQRYDRTGKIDYAYLYDLSEDAAPVIANRLDDKDKTLTNHLGEVLQLSHQESADRAQHWQSANLSKWRSQNLYDRNREQIQASQTVY